jgi:hypothetical protein
MVRNYIVLLFGLIALSSCDEKEADIRIQNLVHNASLERLSYSDWSITYSLIPGETSSRYTIYDEESEWPKMSQIEFYMVRNSQMVYLKTKASYNLNIDDDLLIVIGDTTEVISPFGKKGSLVEMVGEVFD